MLDVLADSSSLGAAVEVVSKLDDGVGRLLDPNGVVLRMHNSYDAPGPDAANPLTIGYFAVVRVADAKFGKTRLGVVKSRLRYEGWPLDGFDYRRLLGSRQECDSWIFPDRQALLNEANGGRFTTMPMALRTCGNSCSRRSFDVARRHGRRSVDHRRQGQGAVDAARRSDRWCRALAHARSRLEGVPLRSRRGCQPPIPLQGS